jgi:Holliday junction resolvasome RuvABC endonuclease subunit
MNILGIDLSLTSPALCFSPSNQFSFETCEFFFLTDREKFLYKHKKLHGEMFPDYTQDSERYNNIAQWIVDIAKQRTVEKVFIEGYSYGSTGRVFQIAENGGVLKFLLWRNHIPYDVVPPTVVKKFATGKGNANKELIEQSFVAETGFNVKKELDMTPKQWNPSSDIIDSFYICKYGKLNETNSGRDKNIQ